MTNDTTQNGTSPAIPWGLRQSNWGALIDPRLDHGSAARLQSLLRRRMQARPTSVLALSAAIASGLLVFLALTMWESASPAVRLLIPVAIVAAVSLPIGRFIRARGLADFEGRYLLGTEDTAPEVMVAALRVQSAGPGAEDKRAVWRQEWQRLSDIYVVAQ